MTVVAYFVPLIPCLLSSILPDSTPWHWKLLVALYDASLYFTGWGVMGATNILLGMIFRCVSNAMETLTEMAKSISIMKSSDITHRRLSIIRAYLALQILTDRLGKQFSTAILLQESTLLLGLVYGLYALTQLAKLSSGTMVAVTMFGSGVTLIVFVILFQFYPLVMVTLESKHLLETLGASLLSSTEKRHLRMCRVLRIRPMGAHTFTINTFCDHSVLVASYFIVLVNI